jgi:hypothetical protein
MFIIKPYGCKPAIQFNEMNEFKKMQVNTTVVKKKEQRLSWSKQEASSNPNGPSL